MISTAIGTDRLHPEQNFGSSWIPYATLDVATDAGFGARFAAYSGGMSQTLWMVVKLALYCCVVI